MFSTKFSRKAQIKPTMSTVADIIILLVIIGLMMLVITKETTSTRYGQIFLSKDSALFIDALHASPNKIIVRYPQNTESYYFKIADNRVSVYSNESIVRLSVGGQLGELIGESYPYTSEKDILFQPSPDYDGQHGLILTKTNTKFIQN